MQSFEDFMESNNSSRPQAMRDMVNALKLVFKQYSVSTRKYVWTKLTSEKGQKQINRLLQSPSAPVSMSDFVKLVEP